METLLAQKKARQQLVQSQMKSLREEYMILKEEDSNLTEEIEQLEEELQKIDDVQTDARFDELIEDIKVEKSFDELLGSPMEEINNFILKPWSHADDENDNDR